MHESAVGPRTDSLEGSSAVSAREARVAVREESELQEVSSTYAQRPAGLTGDAN